MKSRCTSRGHRVYKERSSQEVKDALERLRPQSWRDEDEDTEELAELVAPGGPPDILRLLTLTQKYDLELDMSSVMELSQKYHVSLGRAEQPTWQAAGSLSRSTSGCQIIGLTGIDGLALPFPSRIC